MKRGSRHTSSMRRSSQNSSARDSMLKIRTLFSPNHHLSSLVTASYLRRALLLAEVEGVVLGRALVRHRHDVLFFYLTLLGLDHPLVAVRVLSLRSHAPLSVLVVVVQQVNDVVTVEF